MAYTSDNQNMDDLAGTPANTVNNPIDFTPKVEGIDDSWIGNGNTPAPKPISYNVKPVNYSAGSQGAGMNNSAPKTPALQTPSERVGAVGIPQTPIDQGNTIQNGWQTLYKQSDGTYSPTPTAEQAGIISDTGAAKTARDATNAKLDTQNTKNVNNAYASYNIAKGDFDKNASNYSNYGDVMNKFQGVLTDLQGIQSGGKTPDSNDINTIATKYGLTPDEVSNPNLIFKRGQLTPEAQRTSGITSAQNAIDQHTQNFERSKGDIATNLAQAQKTASDNIADIRDKAQKDAQLATAQGAWNQSLGSTGVLHGIDMIKSDSDKTIGKLNDSLATTTATSAKDLARITQDYNQAHTQAMAKLQDDTDKIKHDGLLQLFDAKDKYGVDNNDLKNQLDKISQAYGDNKAAALKTYLDTIKNANDIANTNRENNEKATQAEYAHAHKTYNDYLANNGATLGISNLNTIADQVSKGLVTPDDYKILKQSMVSSIVATLGANVDTHDMNTIDHLLEGGKSPLEIVASMRTSMKDADGNETNKFAPVNTEKITKTTDLGDKTLIEYTDSKGNTRYEYEAKTKEPFAVAPWSSVFDPTTGKYSVAPEKATKPEWKEVGRDEDGNPVYGFVNPDTQQVTGAGRSPSPNRGGITSSSWTLPDLTNSLQRPKGSTNVWQDTNNPGNIMVLSGVPAPQWATGTYTSPNGRTYYVFPDMNAGLQATQADIEAKLSGGSSWVTPNMTLGQLASGWTSWPNAPYNAQAGENYARYAGYSADTPISKIPHDRLVNAIVNNEGVDVTRTADVARATYNIPERPTGEDTPKDIANKYGFTEKELQDGKPNKKLTSAKTIAFNNAVDEYKNVTSQTNPVYSSLTPEQKLQVDTIAKATYWTRKDIKSDKLENIAQLFKDGKTTDQIMATMTQANPTVRAAFIKDWQTGKTNENKKAIGTAVGHLTELYPLIDKLNNGDITAFNSASNWMKRQTGNADYASTDALRGAMATEIAKTLKGWASPTDPEIADLDKRISMNMWPEAFKGALHMMGDIIGARLRTMKLSYKTATGEIPKDDAIINDAESQLKKIWWSPLPIDGENGWASTQSIWKSWIDASSVVKRLLNKKQ